LVVDDDIGDVAPDAEGATGGIEAKDVVLNPVRLAVFCAVVERRGFTRAAEALALTQSTVSGHIRVLEQALGSPLFERRRHGARLTEVGEAVYEFAVTLRQAVVGLRAQISDLTGGRAGVVQLGAPISPGTQILPTLLARFHQVRPAGELRMQLLPPDLIPEQVLRGRLDFGVVSEAVELPPALQAEPLWRDRVVLIASSDHRLAGRPRVTLLDVAREPFVVAWGRTLGDQALNRAFARAGLASRRIVMQVGNQDGVRQAVLQGVGLGIVHRRGVAADLAAGALIALPLEDLPMMDQTVLIYRRAHHFAPITEQLIAFLRDEAPRLSD